MENNRLGRVFKLAELRQLTDDFSPDHLLGDGGFGEVYKVTLTNGDMIAVKRFASTIKALQDGHFENEAQRLMGLKHPNIVQLVGYCSETESEFVQYYGNWVRAEKPERLLCLEYMPKGDLRDHLSDETSGLDWNTRYTIIKGICCGLLYLHEEWNVTPLIHMDLKPANILLDDKMVPKIADFGLTRLFGEEQTRIYTLSRKGTPGYMPREYLDKGQITKKIDIFSLGVIIIEIITSRRDFPTDETETASQQYIDLVLHNWRRRRDPQRYTSQDIDQRQIKKCIQIGLDCVKSDPVRRPTIKKIIKRLERSDEAYLNEMSGMEALQTLPLYRGMAPPGSAVSFGHMYTSPNANAGLGYHAPNANAGLGYHAPNTNAGLGYHAPNANAAAVTVSNSQMQFPQRYSFISNTHAPQAPGTSLYQQNALSAPGGSISVATHISAGGVPTTYLQVHDTTNFWNGESF